MTRDAFLVEMLIRSIISMRLEEVALELFSEQMDLAFKHDMVAKMWRMAHYPLTDIMRKLHKRATVDGKNEKSGKICTCTMAFTNTTSAILSERIRFYLELAIVLLC